MFTQNMVTEAIPERVYALCKIVEKGSISEKKLKQAMEPQYLKSADYFSGYKKAAEELKLITISDNMVTLAVDTEVINTISSMRKYVNSMLENFKDGQFYKVTKEYFERDAAVLHTVKNISEMAPILDEKLKIGLDAKNMRGWRFWFSFLGFGYVQDMFAIPNAAVFIQDLIDNSSLEKGCSYSFGEFIEAIQPQCNIIIDSDISKKKLNYGVSNALRTLHEKNIINLKHIMDQEDIWSLYPLGAPIGNINDTVTNITICK